MTTEATQPGAEALSVEDRIGTLLDPVEEIQENTAQESTEQEEEPIEDTQQEVVQDSDEAEVDDVEESDEPEDEAEELQLDVSQLAAVLGVDPDSVDVTDTGELKLRTKIDGEIGEATLTELLRGYQLEGHVRNQSQTLSEEKKLLDQRKAELEADLTGRIQQVGALLDQTETNLLQGFNQVDWDTLRATDPAEYAALRQQYQEQYQLIQQAKSQAQEQAGALFQEQAKTQQESYSRYLAEQRAALQTLYPEISDPKVYEEREQAITKYLASNGLNNPASPWEQAFLTALVSDSRGINFVYKAMLYDQGMKKVETTKKKVVKLPKVAKPGAGQSKQEKKQAGLSDAIKKHRKNAASKRGANSLDETANLIEQLL